MQALFFCEHKNDIHQFFKIQKKKKSVKQQRKSWERMIRDIQHQHRRNTFCMVSYNFMYNYTADSKSLLQFTTIRTDQTYDSLFQLIFWLPFFFLNLYFMEIKINIFFQKITVQCAVTYMSSYLTIISWEEQNVFMHTSLNKNWISVCPTSIHGCLLIHFFTFRCLKKNYRRRTSEKN